MDFSYFVSLLSLAHVERTTFFASTRTCAYLEFSHCIALLSGIQHECSIVQLSKSLFSIAMETMICRLDHNPNPILAKGSGRELCVNCALCSCEVVHAMILPATFVPSSLVQPLWMGVHTVLPCYQRPGSVSFAPGSVSFLNVDDDDRQDESDVHLELDLRLSEGVVETSDWGLFVLACDWSTKDETSRNFESWCAPSSLILCQLSSTILSNPG